MLAMGVTFSQLFPPAPTFTEKNLPDLHGKVYVVTGGASGIGAELVEMLYNAGGTVYIAGRSATNAQETIDNVHKQHPHGERRGTLKFLYVDLADLTTIKPAVVKFREAENTLDVLFNNAAVSLPPAGSVSAQGHELTMATNVLGPHLLTQLLLPVLRQTPNSRVVWTTSQNAELGAPKGGFTMDRIRNPGRDQVYNYNASKIGNYFLSSELARADSVCSVTQNPGNVKTNLLRHMAKWQRVLASPLLYPARHGAYTELYAGLSPEVQSGDYVIGVLPGSCTSRGRARFSPPISKSSTPCNAINIDPMEEAIITARSQKSPNYTQIAKDYNVDQTMLLRRAQGVTGLKQE